MRKFIRQFLGSDSCTTAIEYAMIAAGISLAIIITVNSLGTTLNTTFTTLQNPDDRPLSPAMGTLTSKRSSTAPADPNQD